MSGSQLAAAPPSAEAAAGQFQQQQQQQAATQAAASAGQQRAAPVARSVHAVQRLPVAHTCFSTVDLPDYADYELLRDRFEMALGCVCDGIHVE